MKQGVARSSEGDGNSLPARGFPPFTTEGVRREEGFFLRGRSYSHWPHSRFEGCWERQSRRVEPSLLLRAGRRQAPHAEHRGAWGSWKQCRLGRGPGLQRQVSGISCLWRLGVGGAGAARVKYSHTLLSNRMFSATFSSSPDMLNTPGLSKD